MACRDVDCGSPAGSQRAFQRLKEIVDGFESTVGGKLQGPICASCGYASRAMVTPIRVVVFGENVHEHTHEEVRRVYPEGMHHCIADALNRHADIRAETATQQTPEHGLSEQRLAETDVLVWWGHIAQKEVSDAVAARVVRRVNEGMGFIVLHSACQSKPFLGLMGTTGAVAWREAAEKERLWVVSPGHPIAAGIEGGYFEIEHEEMYGEPFGIPEPMQTIFISWFAGGEVFRSGCVWERGLGRVFYFRPGHETYPTYHLDPVKTVLANAVRWAKPTGMRQWKSEQRPVEKALERISKG